MKTLLFILVLFSSQAYAMSDLERGIMWYGNAVSMGTYIAEMEGKIATLKLEYEKKALEAQLEMEQDRQAYYKDFLAQRVTKLKAERAEISAGRESLGVRNQTFDLICDLSKKLFKGILNQEALHEAILQMDEVSPGAGREWESVVRSIRINEATPKLLPADYEQLLLHVLNIQVRAQTLLEDMEDQMKALDAEINLTEKTLKELP